MSKDEELRRERLTIAQRLVDTYPKDIAAILARDHDLDGLAGRLNEMRRERAVPLFSELLTEEEESPGGGGATNLQIANAYLLARESGVGEAALITATLDAGESPWRIVDGLYAYIESLCGRGPRP